MTETTARAGGSLEPARLSGMAAVHRRIEELLSLPRRPVVLGIVGAPGSGKTTLADHLLERLGSRAALLSMDGFHLSNAELARLGRRDRKGAPDTFDAAGYAHALGRIHAGESIFAPTFDRRLDEGVAAGTWISAEAEIVLTEGNYLLLDDTPWADVFAHLDEAWFVGVDDGLRRKRLVARHMRFGMTEAQARAWTLDVDEPNARRVTASRSRAHRIVEVDDLP
ncbi:nucleoside/nucleotide kinase family protein [Pseudactinotalea sp. HY158]|uniref:nucleoside/nucleotide kinase family protein n=1 Tax=Pseudactinotalea sp. HY158 TaxID=2654547 RepID=UPI001E419254|nr:nucleoside/nucleotide kinase family protein [Pseudactinotalea sp. HY158]